MEKSQYDKVAKFKPQFEQAKTGFCRVSRGDLKIIREVYNDLFGQNLQEANMTCKACVIKMMKTMGDAVAKYEDWYSKRYKKNEGSGRNSDQPA